ncbi:MAG: transglycosylase domain-containing protein [Sandaracinaceae bacterium]|nr:transglycosylase domain-containing protein [Sandaracinaceae bacterium]
MASATERDRTPTPRRKGSRDKSGRTPAQKPAGSSKSGASKAREIEKPRPARGWRGALWRWTRRGLVAAVVLVLLAGLGVSGALWYYGRDLPEVEALREYRPPQVTRVVDRDGELLGESWQERRTVVPIERVPRVLVLSVLAAEDADFYQHQGLDYAGLVRALARGVATGRFRGTSTITQQVIKNLVLSPERTMTRKIRELLLARRLEQELTKDQILELYLNHVNFGHGRYGVQEASRYYFGKDVEELTLAEASMLAGIPQSPTHLSPRTHPEAARRRQRFVLEQLEQKRAEHWPDLTLEEIAAAREAEIEIVPLPENERTAPEVMTLAQRNAAPAGRRGSREPRRLHHRDDARSRSAGRRARRAARRPRGHRPEAAPAPADRAAAPPAPAAERGEAGGGPHLRRRGDGRRRRVGPRAARRGGPRRGRARRGRGALQPRGPACERHRRARGAGARLDPAAPLRGGAERAGPRAHGARPAGRRGGDRSAHARRPRPRRRLRRGARLRSRHAGGAPARLDLQALRLRDGAEVAALLARHPGARRARRVRRLAAQQLRDLELRGAAPAARRARALHQPGRGARDGGRDAARGRPLRGGLRDQHSARAHAGARARRERRAAHRARQRLRDLRRRRALPRRRASSRASWRPTGARSRCPSRPRRAT